MTEDDTFNTLKRSTYEIVYADWAAIDFPNKDDTQELAIINKHGWTWDDLFYEMSKRLLYDPR
jgi:hypothetical protein